MDLELVDPMRYIDSTPDQVAAHKVIEEAVSGAYHAFLAACPTSAERTLAIRKLQEARMWANAAIVFEGKRYSL